jgi:hypothetical protein
MLHYLKVFLMNLFKISHYFILLSSGIFLWWYLQSGLSNEITKNNVVDSLATGLISGLMTSFLLFIFAILWKKNIVPWFENLLYQDVCIEGEWSGILIPYLGLDHLDQAMKRAAWRKFQERMKNENISDKSIPIESSSQIENSECKDVSAELIIRKPDCSDESENKPDDETIKISLSSVPIFVRVEMHRIGHKIRGRIIEVGGASKVHTYTINGSFKNLILSSSYETCNKDHIDRGALSLMLKNNGKTFEGFFSSYADNKNEITPMQCILNKQNINSP